MEFKPSSGHYTYAAAIAPLLALAHFQPTLAAALGTAITTAVALRDLFTRRKL